LKGRNSWKIEEGKNNRKKWFFSPDARQGTLIRRGGYADRYD